MNTLLIVALATLSIAIVMFILALFKLQDMMFHLKDDMDIYKQGFEKLVEMERTKTSTYNQMKFLQEAMNKQYEQMDENYATIIQTNNKIIENYNKIIKLWEDIDQKYSDTFEQFKHVFDETRKISESILNCEINLRKDIESARDEVKNYLDDLEFDIVENFSDDDLDPEEEYRTEQLDEIARENAV